MGSMSGRCGLDVGSMRGRCGEGSKIKMTNKIKKERENNCGGALGCG